MATVTHSTIMIRQPAPLKAKIGKAAAVRGMTGTSFISGMLEIAAERTLRRIRIREVTDRVRAALLAPALRVAAHGAESIASAVIEVDAKDDAALALYTRFGFRGLADDRPHDSLPMEMDRRVIGKE